jgi:hypothetical protein
LSVKSPRQNDNIHVYDLFRETSAVVTRISCLSILTQNVRDCFEHVHNDRVMDIIAYVFEIHTRCLENVILSDNSFRGTNRSVHIIEEDSSKRTLTNFVISLVLNSKDTDGVDHESATLSVVTVHRLER